MPSKIKTQKVASIVDKLQKTPNFVLVDCQTTTHKKLEELRKKLHDGRSSEDRKPFFAVKNTLFKIALQRAKKIDLSDDSALRGQTALLTLPMDWSDDLKTFYTLVKTEGTLKFKLGQIDEKIYYEQDLLRLAQLPGKTELITKIIMSFKSPQTRLVRSLNHNMTRLVYILRNKGN